MKRYLIIVFVSAFLNLVSDVHANSESTQRALLIGEPNLTCEFKNYLQHYGAQVVQSPTLDSLDNAHKYTILVICAPGVSEPQRLTTEQSKIIADFVSTGGRAYIEYTTLDCNMLPGWNIEPNSILSRFENIAVTGNNPVLSGLEKDDLLEEHNSYLLNVTAPENAQVLLRYGFYLGTYKVAWQIKELPTNCTITVDLGQQTQLKSALQYYGGLSPDYIPDMVRISIAGTDQQFREIAQARSDSMKDLKAQFPLEGVSGRYVRFYVEKWGKKAIGDFLVLNGIEIYDSNNNNIAKCKPYTFSLGNSSPENDASRSQSLTRGEKPRSWQDESEYLFSTPKKLGFNEKRWNALLSYPLGKGHIYYAATSFSTFRKNNYRLTSRWESLIQGLSLSLFPADQQAMVGTKIVHLRAYTEPRRWSLPGQEVAIHVFSKSSINVKLACQDVNFGDVKEVANGHYVAKCRPQQGEYKIGVKVYDAAGWNEKIIDLSVQPRDVAYRRALDRNMKWFLNAGVLPKDDGSAGVKSTIELGALYAGPAEDLSCPFRLDCQSTTAKAFYLYGDVSGDQAWRSRAENIAVNMMKYQFTDPSKPSYGGWQWLFYDNNAIYLQDDNNRDSELMSWLYARTGKETYLKAVLRNVDFAADTSREDSTLTYWVTTPDLVNKKGRAYLRTIYPFGNFTDWCLYRYHYAYRASGDEVYRKRLDDLIRIYGYLTVEFYKNQPETHGVSAYQILQERGLGIAIHYLKNNDPLRQKLADIYSNMQNNYLQSPDTKKYGRAVQTGDITQVEIGRIYNNDCAINTFKGEPLSDQLYTVPKSAVMQWEVFKAYPCELTKKVVEATLDYLVRIQFENPDSRVDGCWMRSFDMENWEYYGTRYDSNYGAYCAYTGWMNSLASTALAYYLLDEEPFAYDELQHQRAAKTIAEVRKERMPEYLQEINYLKGVQLKTARQPDLGSKSISTLTDGVIEGFYSDGLSAGWSPVEGKGTSVILEGDLGRAVECCRLSIRAGGLNSDFCPDHVVISVGLSNGQMKIVADTELIAKDGSNWLEFDKQPLRYFKIELSRSGLRQNNVPVYIGEIQMIGLQGAASK